MAHERTPHNRSPQWGRKTQRAMRNETLGGEYQSERVAKENDFTQQQKKPEALRITIHQSHNVRRRR